MKKKVHLILELTILWKYDVLNFWSTLSACAVLNAGFI